MLVLTPFFAVNAQVATTTTASSSTTALPAISSVFASSNAGGTGAVISWATDIPSTSQVAYGTSTPQPYQTYSVLDSSTTTVHLLSLDSLLPGMTYHYQVISSAGASSTAFSADQTFVTTGATSTGSMGTSTTSSSSTSATSTDGVSATSTSTTMTSTGTTASSTTSTSGSSITATSTPVIGTLTMDELESRLALLEARVVELENELELFLGGTIGGTGTTTTPTTSSGIISPARATFAGGSHIDFSGRGFGSEESVSVTLDGVSVGTVHADGGGNFSTGSMTLPVATGIKTYQFRGMNSGTTATSVLTVM